MRIRAVDRILIAIAGLLLAALSVGAILFAVGVWQLQLDTAGIAASFTFWLRALVVVVAAAMLALGGYCLLFLFRRDREKGFFLQHTEYGDLNISMHAMENMVRKCIDMHNELKVSNTRIHRMRDGVIVEMRIFLANGVNIPLTVNALQKQIKHYITSCSGVDVKEVRVMVETNNAAPRENAVPADEAIIADATAAAQAGVVMESLTNGTHLKIDEPESGEEKEAFHQRLFKRGDAPHIVPPPPEDAAPAESVEPPPEDAAEEPTREGPVDDAPAEEADAPADESTVPAEEPFASEPVPEDGGFGKMDDVVKPDNE